MRREKILTFFHISRVSSVAIFTLFMWNYRYASGLNVALQSSLCSAEAEREMREEIKMIIACVTEDWRDLNNRLKRTSQKNEKQTRRALQKAAIFIFRIILVPINFWVEERFVISWTSWDLRRKDFEVLDWDFRLWDVKSQTAYLIEL